MSRLQPLPAETKFDMTPCPCPACSDNGSRLQIVQGPPQPDISEVPTPWAVICCDHGRVFLSYHEYVRQMNRPDSVWICPACGDSAGFDDETFETAMATVSSDVITEQE